MSLFREGSFHDFSFEPAQQFRGEPEVENLAVLASRPEITPSDRFRPTASAEYRGLSLSSLLLRREFQSLIPRLLNKTAKVYFLSWAWDLSGEAPFVYPGANAGPTSCLIPVRAGEVREFLGEGTLLFPAQIVHGGISLRIQLWKSRRGTRDFGTTLVTVANTLRESHLSELLTLISPITGMTTAQLALLEAAGLEVADAIGKILSERSDKYVDFYEGYFESAKAWAPATAAYSGVSSQIVLSRLGGNPP
jgi:hypothetical protein